MIQHRHRDAHLLLRLLELGEGDEQLLVHVVLTEELDRALVDAACAVDVAVLLLEARVLDPVAHFRVDDDKWAESRKMSNE